MCVVLCLCCYVYVGRQTVCDMFISGRLLLLLNPVPDRERASFFVFEEVVTDGFCSLLFLPREAKNIYARLSFTRELTFDAKAQ